MSDEEKPKTVDERARELDRAAIDKIGESIRLDTRRKSLARLDDSKIRCPICEKRFEKMVDLRSVLKPVEVLVCHTCKHGIACTDPWLGAWDPPGGKPIPCPRCNDPMKFFCTSTGFWKARCPVRECGATLTAAQPDRKPGVYSDGDGAVDRPIAPGEMILPTETLQ